MWQSNGMSMCTSASYLYLSNNYYICVVFLFCLLSSSALYFVHILDAVLYFRLSGDKFLLFFPLLIYIIRFHSMIKFVFFFLLFLHSFNCESKSSMNHFPVDWIIMLNEKRTKTKIIRPFFHIRMIFFSLVIGFHFGDNSQRSHIPAHSELSCNTITEKKNFIILFRVW